jgi:hypothetical protein
MLNVITQTVVIYNCYAEYHYAECHYAECRYAECRGAPGTDSQTRALLIFYSLEKVKKNIPTF